MAFIVALVAALSVTAGASAGGQAGTRDREAPSTPTNLRVAASTASSVTVAWDASTDNVGVTGYSIYVDGRRVSDGRREADPTPSYTVTGLACGQSIAFSLLAVDAAGNRSERATAMVSTAACPDTVAPSTPKNFKQQATSQTSVVLAWDPSTDNVGVVAYGVYRNGIQVATSATASATVSGLVCGSTSPVDVDAVDAAGNHSARATAWLQTSACGDTQAPSAPTSLTVSAKTTTSLSLAWSPSTDNVGVAGYRVTVAGAPSFNVTSASATVSNLTCGTGYTVSVDAYDAAGNHSASASVTTSTTACPSLPTGDTTPPSQPSGLLVTGATATSVSLGWTASSDNVGVVGYTVSRAGAAAVTVTQPTATVSGLTCGSAYTISVDAFDAAGNHSTPASTTVSTSACADTQSPTAPTNVTATSRTATSIALSWSPSTDNVGVVGYGYYRGTTLVGTTSGTTAIFSGLTCNTNYTLAVDAVDAAGNRSAKTMVGVATTACPDTTAPSQPLGLAASSVTQTGLTLGWSASTDNVGVTGYNVYRNGSKVGTSTSTSYTQSGLTCGTSYTFGVEAYDAAGNTSSRASLTAATAACSPSPSAGEPDPIAGQGYHEVFRDDFTTLNRSVWDDHIWYDDAPDPRWAGFQEVDSSGIFHLRTSRQYTGSFGNYPINTATTLSSGKSFQYGYFEARMKWSAGHGSWPAFWLISTGWAKTGSCSTSAGEIDVMEGQGSEPDVFYGTVHQDSAGRCEGHKQNGNNYQEMGFDLTSGFHTYAALWTPTSISWYVDGTFTHSAPTYPDDNQPMFLLLQEWVGGWTYDPDSTTPDVIENQVDYVTVWQK